MGRIGAGIGALIISLFFMSLIAILDWTITVLILTIVAFIFMIPLRFLACERYVYEQKEVLSFKKILKFVKNNKYLLIFYCDPSFPFLWSYRSFRIEMKDYRQILRNRMITISIY